MGISSLNNVITPDFITTLQKAGSAGQNQAAAALSKAPSEAITVTLQRGARGAAAGVQSLNSGISFLNVASEFTQGLLGVVTELDTLVQKAGKGNITPTNARLYKGQFDRICESYKKIIETSVSKGRDLLNVDDMTAVLKKGGLDVEKVTELEMAFKKVTSFSMVETNAKGEVITNDKVIPPEAFYRALRQATRDPEDPVQNDDGSGAFASSKAAVKEIKDKVLANIEALRSATEIVEKNLTLVRATGFAFLDVAKKVGQSDTAEDVAYQLQGQIRTNAGTSLSEAHNLKAILSAGLRNLAAASSK